MMVLTAKQVETGFKRQSRSARIGRFDGVDPGKSVFLTYDEQPEDKRPYTPGRVRGQRWATTRGEYRGQSGWLCTRVE